MSEASKNARRANIAKAKRLTSGSGPGKVDASSWEPSAPMKADKKTGMRPVSPRTYKHGGKVQGDRGPKRSDKSARGNVANEISTRDTKQANRDKFGSPHIGGMKKGGKACNGGRMADGGKAESRQPREAMYEDGGDSDRSTTRTPKQPKPVSAVSKKTNRAKGYINFSKMDQYKAGGRAERADGGKTGGSPFPAPKDPERAARDAAGFAKVSSDATRDRYANMPTAKIKTYIADMVGKSPDKRPQDWKKHFDAGNAEIAKREGKKDGGSVAGGERPTGDRIPRASGGRGQASDNYSGGLSTKGLDWRQSKNKKGYAWHDGDEQVSGLHTDKGASNTAAATLNYGKKRTERAAGGRTKGKTNINIIVNPGKPDANAMPPAAAGPVRPPPPPMLTPPPPPMAAPPGASPPNMPPPSMAGGPPPMRARGGRLGMNKIGGAGGGLGRLEKANMR